MTIFTVVSDQQNEALVRFLRASCRYFGLRLVIGVHRGPWLTNRLKDRYLLAYTKSLPDDELVLFTDGYDAMLLADEREIAAAYSVLGAPLVFSAEKACWPDPALASAYPPSSTEFRFLNCGGFIGKVEAIREAYRRMEELIRPEVIDGLVSSLGSRTPSASYRRSNQYLWTLLFLRQPDIIALDYSARFFVELAPSDTLVRDGGRGSNGEFQDARALIARERERAAHEWSVSQSRPTFRPTNTQPCHVHFNGSLAKMVALHGAFDRLMPWLPMPDTGLERRPHSQTGA